ncbi:alkene reductase [Streptomyces sp. SID3343]|uniref:alkene reductase n=1 Tax=Streptomyces sp. SID3343 TaxID=2690260 RepID=UPI00136F83CF|nr:alkene reductase [Streptomyces sp. SID3343]MYV97865.1 alkene reductase [Streptomyces sp. SID3343]
MITTTTTTTDTTGPLLRPHHRGALDLPNRIAMAPMTRGRADDATGVPSPLAATYYAQRAGAGLIITEGISIHPLGKSGPGIPGLADDAQEAGWREVTAAVHAAGGRIFAQLWHVGRMTHPVTLDGETPTAPSPVRITNAPIYTRDGLLDHVTPRALTVEEIDDVVAAYAAGARRAIDAGFDGIELHGANGYLIHQFLAENTNLRTDRYGGSRENRLRFVLEVVGAVIAEVGAERVGLRISPDNPENQLAEPDARETYRVLVDALEPLGLAYLHVLERGDYDALADLRPRWSGTLIGNYNGPVPVDEATAERALAGGLADVVAFGRLFITNPDLPARFAAGAPLHPPAVADVYGGGARGYVDYPAMVRPPR